MLQVFERAFSNAEKLVSQLRNSEELMAELAAVASTLSVAFRGGHKALIAGNGGSMADAMHFAEEWTGRFRKDRKPYPVIAMSDPTHMSCVGNDYGYEQVFARMVEGFGKQGDILILLSTSGNSPNLVRAAECGQAEKMQVVGFLGRGGGALKPICDHALVFPGETADRIQELHMLALHTIIEAVEIELGHASE